MKIKGTDAAIDPSKIEMRSSCRNRIRLPYSGELPLPHDKAHIGICINPQFMRFDVIVSLDGKETFYPIEAILEEVLDLMRRFFYKEVEPGRLQVQLGRGLSDFWTGAYLHDFLWWGVEKLDLDKMSGLCDTLKQIYCERMIP